MKLMKFFVRAYFVSIWADVLKRPRIHVPKILPVTQQNLNKNRRQRCDKTVSATLIRIVDGDTLENTSEKLASWHQ